MRAFDSKEIQMVNIIYSVYLMLHLSFCTVRFMAKMCYLEAVKVILTLPF